MLSKTFVFNKIQKTPDVIEDRLNEWLKNHEYKFATQNESATKGKFIVTLFGKEKKSTVRCKVFRDQHIESLDDRVNTFIAEFGMKFITQTFVGSNVYTIIFFDAKGADKDDDNKDVDVTTTTPATDTPPA